MDITLKDIPEEVVEEVKEKAISIVEEYKRSKLTIPEETVATFKEEVDTIRVANDLDKKYFKEEVIIKEPVKEIIEEVITE